MNKYGKVVAERKEFHADEPLFLLRAQDVFAPAGVEGYAALLRAAGAITDPIEERRLNGIADQCENVAAAMRVWQADHFEKVKVPD